MKKYLTPLLLVLLIQQATALTFYQQLCAFNFNWKKYELRAPAGEARAFSSDKEYIRAHLGSVLTILRSNPCGQLTPQQYSSRTHLLELLDEYRNSGNFPINYYKNERIPVFIDENKTHCAVAYLLQQTGFEELALRIAAEDNYAWLKEMNDVELFAWQKNSGLTLEELKLIQGAYSFYMPNAFVLPNKYDIPQKPVCITAYFDKTNNIWCYGKGVNGVLNGPWIQNYSVLLPWIKGYFSKGKRTGQWSEYYQGTFQICRTESWRDDKLNGTRKRYDRSGVLIEEIKFIDGNAVTKTNYNRIDSTVWVRKPLDSSTVWTEVYTEGGDMIASGKEKVYNPGNLLWFQNIELTALNSASIVSRNVVLSGQTNGSNFINPLKGSSLYESPELVQYKKEGEWIYYKQFPRPDKGRFVKNPVKKLLMRDYWHFGSDLFRSISMFDQLKVVSGYDSIHAVYSDDALQDFYGYSATEFTHLKVCYFPVGDQMKEPSIYYSRELRIGITRPRIKMLGQYNKAGQMVGTWKYFEKNGILYKTVAFMVPWKEDDELNIKSLSKK